ncbi:MAG: hypothetical protein AAF202_04500 [Pseudomonadota bacterium]
MGELLIRPARVNYESEFRFMIKVFASLAIVTSLLVVFQNCEEQLAQDLENGDNSGKGVVEVEANDYVQVEYKSFAGDFQNPDVVSIDLNEGTMTVKEPNLDPRTCDLSPETQEELAAILTEVAICKPIPPAPGQPVCLAISTPDITLYSADGDSTFLQPEICKTGRFLCEGRDEQLRTILNDMSCV